MRASLLCVLLLLFQIQGSSAVTPVFVQTGGDVNLDVSEDQFPKDFLLFVWKFKTDEVLVTFTSSGITIRDNYKHRIDTFEKKHSVRLKRLKKSDSGVYIARVIETNDQILAEYNVTVQDPVLPVVLTSSVLSSSPCNLTVTCSTADSNISSSFRCDNKTCYQEGGGRSEVTKSGASLHIHLSNESVICNHSNQVSWRRNETSIRSFCPRVVETWKHPLVVVIVIVLVILIFAFICYQRRRGKTGKTETTGNSVYSVAEFQIRDIQTQNTSPARDGSPPSTYTSTTYILQEGLHQSIYAKKQSGK